MPTYLHIMLMKICKLDLLWVTQVKLREINPITSSQEPKEALGMTNNAPPQWYINIQVSVSLSFVLIHLFQSCLNVWFKVEGFRAAE